MTERALRLLGDMADPVIHRKLFTVEIALGSGLSASFTSVQPLIATTTRRELDMLLARRAGEAGARLLFGVGVRAVERRADSVLVTAENGEWEARHVVLADGARGSGRSLLRLPPMRLGGAAYVRMYPGASDSLSSFGHRALFDLTIGRRGYGWVFPKNDHLNVGVFSQRALSGRLTEDLRSFVDASGLSGWKLEGPFAFPIPVRTGREALGAGAVLLAGDAAGLADPVSGEGISTAISSGRAAAEAVAASIETGEDALSIYCGRVRTEVAPLLESMRRKGNIVYALGPGVLRTIGAVPPLRAVASRLFRSAAGVRDGSLSMTSSTR
jgi:flavin-dependent dehydrogenase